MSVLDIRPGKELALLEAASGSATTYRELRHNAEQVAVLLGRVPALLFLSCQNDAFSIETYVAALDSGHVVCLLDGRQAADRDTDLVDRYQPRWLAGPAGYGERCRNAGLPVERIVEVRGGELIQLDFRPGPQLHPALAVLLSTSGTTGSPQLVRLSRDNVRANAKSIARYLDLAADERPITSLPMHYSFGLSVINSHLSVGASIVLTGESVIQPSFWDAVVEHRCTSMAGVPYTYQMLERIGYRSMDLPTVHTMQQAGGALDAHLTSVYREHMHSKGGQLFVMYGQTEATARIAYVPPDRLADKPGSAGKAIPGGTLRIEAPADRQADGEAIGEVVYEGPNVMLGYATGGDDLRRGDELAGVLHTGDVGYLDREGYLHLVGRTKRMTKVYGLRVNLDDVERMVAHHGPAAVVGATDAIWVFCAFGDETTIPQLGRELARRMRLHRQSVHVRHVAEIPKTSSGKTDYGTVERWIPK